MGLLTIIKKQKLKDREVRCLVLGLDNSGKSTVVDWALSTHKNKPRQPVTPTVGFQIHTLPYQGHNIQIWDIGGQSTLRPYWDNYFDKTDVLLWIIDIAAAARVGESVSELEVILQNRDRLGYSCRIIVLLNKKDLVNKPTEAIDAMKRRLDEILKLENIPIEIKATDALSGDGLEELLPSIIGHNKSFGGVVGAPAPLS
ncbi:Arf family GTPase CIN4 [Lachancea thermotolerans CBS 6340]|uniref:KLTH0E09592p n=1 Tax=Lachancea thermotolerans (strain ATCC 56472 / CBS 6340 / NRRL Y-8284) TaxID=559295 RepID=C5DI44_LACTC|nr:KLTH0E09592p [Lachancea thermotolerans CBS 6340]CAR23455.1 KLTH0E09592p [Lachancea thermotolerans CBS 6340]